MSASAFIDHHSSSSRSHEQELLPPQIPKPNMTKHGLTNKFIQGAFEVDYYLLKTKNWQYITISAVIKALRNACEDPLKRYRSEIEPQIRSFAHQNADLKNQIYNEFVQNLQNGNFEDDLRAILFDMLESTEEEERWLFQWIVAIIIKSWRRKEATASSTDAESSSAAEKIGSPDPRKKPLAIDERT
ncbi:hypothetical protein TWF788_003238 [Orbilia oligospora]|uniref:Uncharacterized protein n=1 Tax=Orbilia oligospora TaxID=2813651 RepID=A0A7C8PZU2_ORBOL|nr:hypothetical protein TWF788_003238 [Orbilia oligospora]